MKSARSFLIRLAEVGVASLSFPELSVGWVGPAFGSVLERGPVAESAVAAAPESVGPQAEPSSPAHTPTSGTNLERTTTVMVVATNRPSSGTYKPCTWAGGFSF